MRGPNGWWDNEDTLPDFGSEDYLCRVPASGDQRWYRRHHFFLCHPEAVWPESLSSALSNKDGFLSIETVTSAGASLHQSWLLLMDTIPLSSHTDSFPAKIILFLSHVYGCYACNCVCALHAWHSWRKENVIRSLELEPQTLVNGHVVSVS